MQGFETEKIVKKTAYLDIRKNMRILVVACHAAAVLKKKICKFDILIMTRHAIIERTLQAINQLPEEKAEEISTFAEFIMKQYEEHQLTQGIQKMTAQSSAFDFLNQEEDLYTEADLKEVYNGQK